MMGQMPPLCSRARSCGVLRQVAANLGCRHEAAAASSQPSSEKRRRGRATPLTRAELKSWQRDGFLILRGWWTEQEVATLREATATDPLLGAHNIPIAAALDFTVWWYPGDDTYGMFARNAATVAAAAALIRDEPYMEQQSMFLKPAHAPGRIRDHQDFG